MSPGFGRGSGGEWQTRTVQVRVSKDVEVNSLLPHQQNSPTPLGPGVNDASPLGPSGG